MFSRRYKTAYAIAKIVEVSCWFILIGGIIAGIVLGDEMKNSALGFIVALFSIVFGLALVFSSQLILIFIDTENNMRQTLGEVAKINAMLADTLGGIAANLNKIASQREVKI